MKIDQNMLLIGGLVLAIGAFYFLVYARAMANDAARGIFNFPFNLIFGGPLKEEASMYAGGYY